MDRGVSSRYMVDITEPGGPGPRWGTSPDTAPDPIDAPTHQPRTELIYAAAGELTPKLGGMVAGDPAIEWATYGKSVIVSSVGG